MLKFTDVFITNGGFGGVQLSLANGVPVVVAGLNEGKSDVNARVEYSGVGINLRKESPEPSAVAKAVSAVLRDPQWKQRAEMMKKRLGSDKPADVAADVVESVGGSRSVRA